MQAVVWYVNTSPYAVGGSGPVWFPGRAGSTRFCRGLPMDPLPHFSR